MRIAAGAAARPKTAAKQLKATVAKPRVLIGGCAAVARLPPRPGCGREAMRGAGAGCAEPRQIGGADSVPLGSNNSGRGVGGSMIHYAGYTPRFHPSDFRTFTQDGRRRLAHRVLPPAAVPRGNRGRVVGGRSRLALGSPAPLSAFTSPCKRQWRDLPAWCPSGWQRQVGRAGSDPNGRFGNRPHCIYRGFCLQRCKVNVKASPLITMPPTHWRTAPRSARTATSPASSSATAPHGSPAWSTCAPVACIINGLGPWRWRVIRSRRRDVAGLTTRIFRSTDGT